MTTCGDQAAGVNGCEAEDAVWVEFTDAAGTELAAVLCHGHAARLRAGEDIWDHDGYAPLPYTVTGWRAS